ncbi:MAG TPA: hypothetical protein VM452_04345 [Caulifigura sp.]|nr:hypothetical protein [Caulifigura sp.]
MAKKDHEALASPVMSADKWQPRINQFEAVMAGAKVVLVDGLIADCGRIVRAGNEAMSWFDLSTLRESTGAPAMVVCPREQGTFPR